MGDLQLEVGSFLFVPSPIAPKGTSILFRVERIVEGGAHLWPEGEMLRDESGIPYIRDNGAEYGYNVFALNRLEQDVLESRTFIVHRDGQGWPMGCYPVYREVRDDQGDTYYACSWDDEPTPLIAQPPKSMKRNMVMEALLPDNGIVKIPHQLLVGLQSIGIVKRL